MDEQLQSLLDRTRREGVERAEGEAEAPTEAPAPALKPTPRDIVRRAAEEQG